MTSSAGDPPPSTFSSSNTISPNDFTVNSNSPFGSVNYTTGANGQITQNTTLSQPEQQQLDQQNTANIVTNEGINNLANQINWGSTTPVSADGSQTAWNNAYNSIIARNQPQQQQQLSQLQTQLASQGIVQGSDAYNQAMRQYNDSQNDFNLGAQSQATSQEEADQQMQIAAQQAPINELEALRSGSSIQLPQDDNVDAANLLNANIGQQQYNSNVYNQKVASANATNAGEWKLASSVASDL